MNLKEVTKRERKREDPDVNITAVLNVFLIMIPFLLLTAVFVRIAVVELSLPSLGHGGEGIQKPQSVVINILAIKEDHFELKSTGLKFPDINGVNDKSSYEELARRLKEIKQKYTDSQDIVISPVGSIKYDVIVKVMDRCRENGFPNISISG